jgi:hypothetical protein
MSDSRLDIERDKYLEWKDQQKEAMRSFCEDCENHNTKNCDWYDPEEETWDFEECFKTTGWW